MSVSPRSRPRRAKESQSTVCPYRCTGRIALTALPRGPSSTASTAAGSRLNVAGSMSASTAVAPARRMALTEAKKLNGVVTTAMPGPIPAAASASHSASVPEEQPTAWATPSSAAAAFSNAATAPPRINCRESRTPASASRISSRRGAYCRSRSSMGTGGWTLRLRPCPPLPLKACSRVDVISGIRGGCCDGQPAGTVSYTKHW